MLELEGIDCHYAKVHVLRGVSLVVNRGEIVSMIGPNAAGKTTTLRVMAGLKQPSAGRIRYLGEDITRLLPFERVRRGLVLVPEGRQIFPKFTVLDNLRMGAYQRPDRGAIDGDLESVYELFPRLRERRDQRGGSLSGGEQQMLAIGRGLMAQPKSLLLDEPSLGLAPIVVSEIARTIRELASRGLTIMLVERNAAMAALLDVMAVRATGDPGAALVDCGEPGGRVEERICDVLVVGGGTGGIAAALAAARAGRGVCLLEETDWVGGQLTAQGVAALDEHEHIERFGGTRSYYVLREAIRGHYRRVSPALAVRPHANPGNCWVTRLAFEPRVAVDVLHAMAQPFVESGRLAILTRTKAASAQVSADRIESVLAANLDDRRWRRFRPRMVIDATELGDLLPLAGAEYIIGAESTADTGERHAQPFEPKPHCVQSLTYTFVLERMAAGERHLIPKPESYERYRDSQPYALRIHVHGGEIYGEETRWLEYQVLEQAPDTKGGLWTYRRLIDASLFPPRAGYPRDISMLNWPGNDYRDQSMLDRSPREQAQA